MKKILQILGVTMLSMVLCACASDFTGEKEADVQTETDWNIYTYSETEDGVKYELNPYSVSDEKELADLGRDAGSTWKLPSYIPDGYEFQSAELSYFLTKEILEQAEVTETQEGGSVTYQYVLPKSVLKQISGFYIEYVNEADQKLVIETNYVEDINIDTGNHDFQQIELQGYEISRLGVWNKQNVGEFLRNMDPIHAYMGNAETTLDCVLTRISVSDAKNESTEGEEIVKIAESM